MSPSEVHEARRLDDRGGGLCAREGREPLPQSVGAPLALLGQLGHELVQGRIVSTHPDDQGRSKPAQTTDPHCLA